MRAFSASELLAVWERGSGRTPVGQALVILALAFPEVPYDVLAKLDVGQRDLCLLHLRSLTFGSQLNALADCQNCDQYLELDFDTKDLSTSSFLLPDLEALNLSNIKSTFRSGDYEVTFRLPNSIDLAGLNGTTGHEQLLALCVISAQHKDDAIAVAELPSEVVSGLIDQMSQIDSIADLTLSVTCPTCGHTWNIVFDIVSFFWGEINAWSARLVREVHTLAMAYGWREADILAMSAWRRQRYLELIGI